jgi:Glycosyltransferase family 87
VTAPETSARSRSRLADAFVPACSLLLLAAMLALVLGVAGKTLGYDFEAYAAAARRLVNGEKLYDSTVSLAGGFAIYLYPPPFALALTPLLLLPEAMARAVWVLAMALCLPLGAALLPTRRNVRWAVVCLGALSWPFLYSVKLGQVGPLLFVLFAAAWRWRQRATPLGAAIAVGALVKVQPAILIPWAAVTGRWRAAAIALVASAAAATIATVFTGVSAWTDYAALLGRVSSAVATPHNCSPGAVLYQAGLPEAVAEAGQLASTALAAAAVLLLWRYGREEVGLLGTVVASQLLTPLLWDHYAVILLLPTAWLLERGRSWAVAIPLLGWIPFFPFAGHGSPFWPATASVPLTFFGVLAVLLFEAHRERRTSGRRGPDAAYAAPAE